MPPGARLQRAGRGRGGQRRRAWTRACWTWPYGRVLRLVEQIAARAGRGGTVRRRRAPRAGPPSAAESAVLLKNDGGVLPLRPAAGSPGGGDRRVRPHPAVPGRRQLPGEPDQDRRPARRAGRRPRLGGRPSTSRRIRARRPTDADPALLDEAVRASPATLTWSWCSSACRRRPSPRASTGPTWTCRPTSSRCWTSWRRSTTGVVVVLANGSAVRMSTWDHRAAAVLECWLGGQAAGGAVADLLTGAANPSGKLAETIPLRLEDNSSYLNFPGDHGRGPLRRGRVRRLPGVRHGGAGGQLPVRATGCRTRRSRSPTSTAIVDRLGRRRRPVGDRQRRVTNTGERAGARGRAGLRGRSGVEVARPVRELKGFARVGLEPGAIDDGQHRAGRAGLRLLVERHGRLGGGEPASSRSPSGRPRATSPTQVVITLEAPSLAAPADGDSTLHEWLADEHGRAVLTRPPSTPALSGGRGVDQGDRHLPDVLAGGVQPAGLVHGPSWTSWSRRCEAPYR